MRPAFLLTGLLIVAPPVATAQPQAQVAFPQLTFDRPVDLQAPPDGSDRLFVVEQPGRILVLENAPTVTQTKVFLDLTSAVSYGGERGLLGLAFHPHYADSGYFYVNYTRPGPLRTVISRFKVSADNPDSAVAGSERVILTQEQPYGNHNGGQLAFGPDGYLYIGLGDGGSGGDPLGHGQSLQTLLGTMLRIDVDHPAAGLAYGIPADNPYVGQQDGSREEIFAYGLRNPWRFSFDSMTGQLWLADVGQDTYEEIDLIAPGGNYGWNVMEGAHCFDPMTGCDTSGLTLPVWEYDHSEGFSITGGYVYRGTRLPQLYGKYVYADWGSGTVWSLEFDGTSPAVSTELFQMGAFSVSSFGVDQEGELYLCSFDGRIYTITDVLGSGTGERLPEGIMLHQNHPNPFNPHTTIHFELDRAMRVRLSVFDTLGRELAGLADSRLGPGSHQAVWNGRSEMGREMPAGLYIARLVTSHYTKSIKMVLLK